MTCTIASPGGLSWCDDVVNAMICDTLPTFLVVECQSISSSTFCQLCLSRQTRRGNDCAYPFGPVSSGLREQLMSTELQFRSNFTHYTTVTRSRSRTLLVSFMRQKTQFLVLCLRSLTNHTFYSGYLIF